MRWSPLVFNRLGKQIVASSKSILAASGGSAALNLRCRFKHSSECNMSKKALVLLAPGSEEMEFTITSDVLRRGKIDVVIAGVSGADPVKCSRNICIVPDVSLESVKDSLFDVIVMPGGLQGSKAMADSETVGAMLKKQEAEGRMIAAICAAPCALAAHKIFVGKSVTSYPSMQSQLESIYNYVTDQIVVSDGHLITSQGPGTTFDFALTVLEALTTVENSAEVAKGMLLKWPR